MEVNDLSHLSVSKCSAIDTSNDVSSARQCNKADKGNVFPIGLM